MAGYRPRKTPAAVRKASANKGTGASAIFTATLAGTFAALASVFAKLTMDARTVNFLRDTCNTLVAPTTPICTSMFIAKDGETSPVSISNVNLNQHLFDLDEGYLLQRLIGGHSPPSFF